MFERKVKYNQIHFSAESGAMFRSDVLHVPGERNPVLVYDKILNENNLDDIVD
jgi:hypothetical protein